MRCRLSPTADVPSHTSGAAMCHVDGSGLSRTFFAPQAWSVLPCVRPSSAVHMTAGHNALRGSGPGQLTMRWHMWVVLIAGSTGSALRAVRPPNLQHHAGCPGRSRLPRKCRGLFVTLALGHHGPGHPRNLVGERDAATLVGRRPSNAVSQGRCPVPWILA
jgi:hypothetical protein